MSEEVERSRSRGRTEVIAVVSWTTCAAEVLTASEFHKEAVRSVEERSLDCMEGYLQEKDCIKTKSGETTWLVGT